MKLERDDGSLNSGSGSEDGKERTSSNDAWEVELTM